MMLMVKEVVMVGMVHVVMVRVVLIAVTVAETAVEDRPWTVARQ